ncbi:hypothetical protein J2S40_000960 [Nocardioides luteus]|uniref:GerMN domain-containing protein n=1 Tax=Nocardioides luteus TaxID=1844 RepID=A0ABQ5STP9_9ACTN|nr:GerMN domain-containing protein [Nocardioides luteus]MDR7309902.1 hypothetical protein [Nocardioides luteus]GGR59689.1 hypothetical protein GCM10010197_28230 [Nocardioides luteus]GLJ67189.1 hypothetical protein GCM10017579_12250 [Nocardioides luteus]
MRLLRTSRAAVAAGLVLLVASSCGVPTDDEVRTIDPADVPYRLLDDSDKVPAGSSDETTGPRLYWVDPEERLVGRPAASICSETLTGVAKDILAQLGDGPSRRALRAGLGTALPPEGWLELEKIDHGTAHLRVSSDDPITTNRILLATAQTVLSLTSVPGVDRVELEYDDGPLQVPRSSGELAEGPLRSADYRTLLADPDDQPRGRSVRRGDLCPD